MIAGLSVCGYDAVGCLPAGERENAVNCLHISATRIHILLNTAARYTYVTGFSDASVVQIKTNTVVVPRRSKEEDDNNGSSVREHYRSGHSHHRRGGGKGNVGNVPSGLGLCRNVTR
jgi:hypothetical protein